MNTTCCIAGGGPAGMMLGFLLAREGVDVVVLEKWPDFFRDFRGDTIHPSTMEMLSELGLLDAFLTLPHQKTRRIEAIINDQKVSIADFSHLKTPAPYIAFMPQWDFLNFIAEQAKVYPNFHLLMETEATDIIEKEGVIVGIQAKTREKEFEIKAQLVIGADGRHSIIREKSKLKVTTSGTPIDVLWFTLPQGSIDTDVSLGYAKAGQFMVMLDRDSYWQCGYVIHKGEFEKMKMAGINTFQNNLIKLVPAKEKDIRALTWDSLRLLSVTVDHLKTWYRPGLLCIGDSAHAMSPVGGVGINLAIQDAVAAARILAPELLKKDTPIAVEILKTIQARRMFPARLIQRIQVFIQNRIITPILKTKEIKKVPLPFRILKNVPILQRIPAYFIGIGVRPEHIEPKKN